MINREESIETALAISTKTAVQQQRDLYYRIRVKFQAKLVK